MSNTVVDFAKPHLTIFDAAANPEKLATIAPAVSSRKYGAPAVNPVNPVINPFDLTDTAAAPAAEATARPITREAASEFASARPASSAFPFVDKTSLTVTPPAAAV